MGEKSRFPNVFYVIEKSREGADIDSHISINACEAIAWSVRMTEVQKKQEPNRRLLL